MNKKLLVSAVFGLSAFAAQALADQPYGERWPRWYVGLSGGVAFLDKTDIGGAQSGSLDYDTGGIGTISLGYMPPFRGPVLSGLRLEAEGGYHYNTLHSLNLGGAQAATNGHIQAYSYMGNLYYDMRNGSQWTPYVGA